MVFNFLFVQCTSRVEKIQYTSKFLGRRNIKILQRGVSNGPIQFESARKILPLLELLAKFCLCSNCSQKLDECSLARARKIFATACMLGFSLKFPCRVVLTIICVLDTGHNISRIENWKSLAKYARATIFWKNSSPVY